MNFFQYRIRDTALQSETTVVVYSMIPIGGSHVSECPLLGITSDGSDLSFEVQCSRIDQ